MPKAGSVQIQTPVPRALKEAFERACFPLRWTELNLRYPGPLIIGFAADFVARSEADRVKYAAKLLEAGAKWADADEKDSGPEEPKHRPGTGRRIVSKDSGSSNHSVG